MIVDRGSEWHGCQEHQYLLMMQQLNLASPPRTTVD